MSVRIYQLSKQLGMDNQALLALLRERGYQVKSPSSTVDNISAESLVSEFGKKKAQPPKPAAPTPAPKTEKPEPKKPQMPQGVFVRSKAEVEREREAREANALKIATRRRPAPTPPPLPKRPPGASTHSETGVSILKEQSGASAQERTPAPAAATATAPQPTGPKRPAPLRMPMPSIGRPAMAKPLAKKDQEPKENKGTLQVRPPIVVRDFAKSLDIKPFHLISELMERGIFASMNQAIEPDVATQIAQKHGYTLEIKQRGEPHKHVTSDSKKKKVVEEKSELRPPIVCILGHVDHGKTTLLDTLRKTNVVAGEAGGITQHIGAYQVIHDNKPITFIDTPGHSAFENMRARGANLTDIAVLVVAADDGFKPQTDEALKHTKAANVPIIVAINKIDAKGANIDRVKTQMQERGIGPEDWGHDTITVPISALKGENLNELLEMILLQGELMELQAPVKGEAQAIVLESQMEVGRGPTASVIIQKGTLKTGDALVSGTHYCKVRTMTDALNRPVKAATPAMPVKITGWSGTPEAGAVAIQIKNEREARKQADENGSKQPVDEEETISKPGRRPGRAPKRGIDDLNALLGLTPASGNKSSPAEQKKLYVVVKGDVSGSVEAVCENLKSIPSEKVKVEIVNSDVGSITPGDIRLAQTAGALLVGFNTKIEAPAIALAKQHSVQILQDTIIYKLIESVQEAMAGLLEPEYKENKIGAAEVRQVFSVSGTAIAGCMVTQGQILKSQWVRLLRKKKELHKSKVRTLKRFKDDTTEVRAGYECGIQLDQWSDYQEGDILEAFTIETIRPSL